MNDYKRIENQTKKKLIDMGKTMADLARTLEISQQLLWRYMNGRIKKVTPQILLDMVNDAIVKL